MNPDDNPLAYDPWSSGPSVEQQLRTEPYRFDFFQAVRILHRMDRDRRPVGTDAAARDECVRFAALLSLDFPPSDVWSIVPPQDDDAGNPQRMVVAFMGLFGPSGALPRFYTELILDRARNRDRTLQDFLDLFNHRLISLFYRGWEKYHFWIGYERAEMAAEQDALSSDPSRHRSFVTEVRPRLDRFSQCLLDLPGLGVPSLRYRASIRDRLEQRTAVADATLRYYVGLLAQQHRSAVGLEGILQEYFSVEVAVLQFVGQWLLLERENQTQLIAGGNIELGTTAVIGQRVRDLQGRFRIRIGPMTYDEFQQLLPSGKGYRGLTDLARLYAGCTFDIDAQLVLKASEVPWCEVGCHADQPALLGWNTWIRGHDLSRDVDDTVLLLAG